MQVIFQCIEFDTLFATTFGFLVHYVPSFNGFKYSEGYHLVILVLMFVKFLKFVLSILIGIYFDFAILRLELLAFYMTF